jgi:Holliday junction resolvase RusA-like endonuclease
MAPNGRTYTPRKTLEAQAILRDQYQGPLFDGPVSVLIVYGIDHQVVTITPLAPALRSSMRGDLDNYSKLTLDALNKVAWVDDKQVFELHAHKSLSF